MKLWASLQSFYKEKLYLIDRKNILDPILESFFFIFEITSSSKNEKKSQVIMAGSKPQVASFFDHFLFLLHLLWKRKFVSISI